MSARQQAREAVAAADIEWDDWSWKDLPTQTADVASDVWEPVVQACQTAFVLGYDALAKLASRGGCDGAALARAMRKVKEALDE